MLSPGLTEEMMVLGGFSAKRSEHPTALYQRGWSTGQSDGIDGALAERNGVRQRASQSTSQALGPSSIALSCCVFKYVGILFGSTHIKF